MLSGIDNPRMIEVQTLNGLNHRLRRFGSFTEFTFNSVSASMRNKKEIDFCAAVSRPKGWLRWHDQEKTHSQLSSFCSVWANKNFY